jgi:hypothetical protein
MQASLEPSKHVKVAVRSWNWDASLYAFKATMETKAHGGVRFMGHIIKPGDTFTIAGIKPRGRGRRKLTQFRIVGVM